MLNRIDKVRRPGHPVPRIERRKGYAVIRCWLFLALLLAACATGCRSPSLELTFSDITLLRAETLNMVQKGDSDRMREAFRTADQFLGQGRWREALAQYQLVVLEWPSGSHRVPARFWIAYCHEQLGHDVIAQPLYGSLVTLKNPFADEARRRHKGTKKR